MKRKEFDSPSRSEASSEGKEDIETAPPPKQKKGTSRQSASSKPKDEGASDCKTPSPKGKKGSGSTGASPKEKIKCRPWTAEEDSCYLRQLLVDDQGKPWTPDHRRALADMNALAEANGWEDRRTYDAVRVHWPAVKNRILAIGGGDACKVSKGAKGTAKP